MEFQKVKKLNEIQNKLAKRSKFEELLFHISNDNIEEILNLISNFDTLWLQNIIISITSALSYKQLGDIFSHTGKPLIKFSKLSILAQYFYARGLISEIDFDQNIGAPDKKSLLPAKIYEEPIIPDTIEWYIYKDDVRKFVSYYSNNNIDLTQNIEIHINTWVFFDFIELACFFGSINILKYCFFLIYFVKLKYKFIKICITNKPNRI